MMLHEFQAKALLADYGVPCMRGPVAPTAQAALQAARALGNGPYVVKAQIHAGGRGRAGGVRIASTPRDVGEEAEKMLGRRLVTAQTGPEGKNVDRVMICPAIDVRKEYYLSLLWDPVSKSCLLVAAAQGGVNIEKTARTAPEKVLRQSISPLLGFRDYYALDLGEKMGMDHDQAKQLAALCQGLYRLFLEKDCTLIELNPLALTDGERLTALDAKIVLDDNALYRHAELRHLLDARQMEENEAEAAEIGIQYVQLEGDIGCVVNGAGLAMATMDMIRACGGTPANFLDVGGSATAEKITAALEILLRMPSLKGIFINIFGGIMQCDVIAQGIVQAAREMRMQVPLVVRLAGANAQKAKDILKETDLRLHWASSLGQGAKWICALAAGEKEGNG